MRKLMWLFPAIALWNVMPAAQAQFVPRYGPRPLGPYGPSAFDRYDPLAPQVPRLPGLSGSYNPLNRSPFTGPSFGRQPGMPPTVQDIFKEARIVATPWPNHDLQNYDPLGLPGLPGGYNPLNPTPFTGQTFGWQPWMPPTALDIIRQAQTGNPALGHRFGPWPSHDPLSYDPLAALRGPGRLNMDLTAPNVGFDRMPQSGNLAPSVNLSDFHPNQVNPKLFENRPLIPSRSIGEFETRPIAKMGDTRLPSWFRWEYAAGVLLIATLAGMLYQVFRRDSLTE